MGIINAETIIRTADGGKNWQVIAKFKGINDLALSHDGKIWIVGKEKVLYSKDTGLTWETPQISPSNLLKHGWNTIEFLDFGRGMIFGGNGKVAYTKNGGESWNVVDTDVPVYIDEQDNLIWASLKYDGGIVIGSGQIYKFKLPDN